MAEPRPPGLPWLTRSGQDPQPAADPPKPGRVPPGPRQTAPDPDWFRSLDRRRVRP
jgi:hypothetical protein